MTLELWTKIEMDFGQNAHLQRHLMKIECQQDSTTITIAPDVQQTVQREQKSQNFGEMSIVMNKKAIQGKLNVRGTVGLFVGY
jgi:hypothetical protein